MRVGEKHQFFDKVKFLVDKGLLRHALDCVHCAKIRIIFHFCGGVWDFVVFLQADISRDFSTTIRQVRAEAYRLSTTAARISRQL